MRNIFLQAINAKSKKADFLEEQWSIFTDWSIAQTLPWCLRSVHMRPLRSMKHKEGVVRCHRGSNRLILP
jgi:hypothetical protein